MLVNGIEVAEAEELCVMAFQASYLRVKKIKTPYETLHNLQVNMFGVWVTLCYGVEPHPSINTQPAPAT